MAIYMVQSKLWFQLVFVKYGYMTTVIELLQYQKHNWIIRVDLKIVAFLLGQQRVYTKLFICACGTAELERSIVWR